MQQRLLLGFSSLFFVVAFLLLPQRGVRAQGGGWQPAEPNLERDKGAGKAKGWSESGHEEVNELDSTLEPGSFCCESEGQNDWCIDNGLEAGAGHVIEEMEENGSFEPDTKQREGAREWFDEDPESPFNKEC